MLKRIPTVASSAIPLDEGAMSAALTRISGAVAAAMENEYDDIDGSGSPDYETLGNLSYRRSPFCDYGCFCPASCPADDPLNRIARWVKIIARSKHGLTVAFGIAPLLVGLLVGIYLGRRYEQRQKVNQTKDPQVREKQSCTLATTILGQIEQHVMTGYCWLKSVLAKSGAFFVFAAPWSQSNARLGTCALQESSKELQLADKDKTDLQLTKDCTSRQSGVDLELIPKHIAFIMDGNRRYGKSKYKSASRGHVDGGYKLRDMVNWALEECIQEMTVYAFSTENWNRSKAEIDTLMSIFCQQCEELRKESVKLQIVVRVLSTETDLIPNHVKDKLKQLEDDTRNCKGSLYLNVCLSYGSRGEIVSACRSIAADCRDGKLTVGEITEKQVESRLLTCQSPSPDILLRTSGEVRLSNFLLWQCAYSEFFFLTKHWPDLEKEDLLKVIREYALGRKRRFGA